MDIKLSAVGTPYTDALRTYLKLYPGEITEAVILRARMLFQRTYKLMPSRSKSIGNKTVERDMLRTAKPITAANFDDTRIRRLITTGDVAALQSIADHSNSKSLKGFQIVNFTPETHKRARNRRGVVRSDKKQLTPDKKAWNLELRTAKKAVGSVKSALAVAVQKLGGKVPPRWLDRPRMLQMKNRSNHKTKPNITARNNAHYSSRFEDLVVYAAKIETRVMMKDLKKRLELVKKKSGFKK